MLSQASQYRAQSIAPIEARLGRLEGLTHAIQILTLKHQPPSIHLFNKLEDRERTYTVHYALSGDREQGLCLNFSRAPHKLGTKLDWKHLGITAASHARTLIFSGRIDLKKRAIHVDQFSRHGRTEDTMKREAIPILVDRILSFIEDRSTRIVARLDKQEGNFKLHEYFAVSLWKSLEVKESFMEVPIVRRWGDRMYHDNLHVLGHSEVIPALLDYDEEILIGLLDMYAARGLEKLRKIHDSAERSHLDSVSSQLQQALAVCSKTARHREVIGDLTTAIREDLKELFAAPATERQEWLKELESLTQRLQKHYLDAVGQTLFPSAQDIFRRAEEPDIPLLMRTHDLDDLSLAEFNSIFP